MVPEVSCRCLVPSHGPRAIFGAVATCGPPPPPLTQSMPALDWRPMLPQPITLGPSPLTLWPQTQHPEGVLVRALHLQKAGFAFLQHWKLLSTEWPSALSLFLMYASFVLLHFSSPCHHVLLACRLWLAGLPRCCWDPQASHA